MVSLSGSAFSRRPDRSGNIVSTCKYCFAAIKASPREAELESAEREHTCNPETLENWRMFVDEIKRGERRRHQSL